MSAQDIWHRHKEWDVSLNAVHRYCRGVRRQWRAEALSDDRRLDRDAIRKMCLQVIQTAYEIKDTVQVGEHEYEWVSRPDLKAVNTAIKTLCQLDGLFELAELHGPRDINTFITVLADGYGVAPERLVGLRKALATGSPAMRVGGLPRKG